jgi:SAM-dependent methyltransferase
MLKSNPTERFSSRVHNYARFRPRYPKEILDVLKSECGLGRDSVVADIASGTGIFSRLLLENGNRVFGVEPNPEMRRAGEQYLVRYQNFTSVAGTAENTGLANQSVDLVTSAQAAHWFDREKAIPEFQRILKPGGYLMLLWNERDVEASAFGRDYEQLVRKYGIDYHELQYQGSTSEGDEFFAPFPCMKRTLSNDQGLDYAALEGLLLSASYMPQPGHPSYAPMIAAVRGIFDAHQIGGKVRMEYDTKLYFGQLSVD